MYITKSVRAVTNRPVVAVKGGSEFTCFEKELIEMNLLVEPYKAVKNRSNLTVLSTGLLTRVVHSVVRN